MWKIVPDPAWQKWPQFLVIHSRSFELLLLWSALIKCSWIQHPHGPFRILQPQITTSCVAWQRCSNGWSACAEASWRVSQCANIGDLCLEDKVESSLLFSKIQATSRHPQRLKGTGRRCRYGGHMGGHSPTEKASWTEQCPKPPSWWWSFGRFNRQTKRVRINCWSITCMQRLFALVPRFSRD